MAEPFLSEIRIMSFNFPPRGWAFCNGQLLPISQNQGLFSLLGSTFGGDGRVNFGLPDCKARVPIHMGNGHVLGEKGGEQAHTVSIQEMPMHTHKVNAQATSSTLQNKSVPTGNLLSNSQAVNIYSNNGSDLVSLHTSSIGNIGGSQAHQNMQPFLVLNFCIALQGIFPSTT